MTITVLWLLLLTMSSTVTSAQGQHTHVTTGEFTQGHATTQTASSVAPGPNATADPPEAPHHNGELTLSPADQRPTTGSTPSQVNSSPVPESTTDRRHEATTPQTTGATNQTRNTTSTPGAPSPELSSSDRGLDTGGTTASQWTSVSTQFIPTASASTKPADTSSSTSTDSGGDATHDTSQAATTSLSVHATTTKPGRQGDKAAVGGHPGKVVAGIIGGALVLMVVAFLVILIQKRKIQKQQISTTDWAGPSPFLEGGANNGHAAMRPSNRISFSGFLPQRLSKRLSLLPETDEELEDIIPGTTFGDKRQANPPGPQLEGGDVSGPQLEGGDVSGPQLEGGVSDAPAGRVKGTGDVAETSEPHPQDVSTETSPADPPAPAEAASHGLDD